MNCPPKIGDFELSWIFRRDRVGFANCLYLRMHHCATVSAVNFHVLICSGRRASTSESFIRSLACPESRTEGVLLAAHLCRLGVSHSFTWLFPTALVRGLSCPVPWIVYAAPTHTAYALGGHCCRRSWGIEPSVGERGETYNTSYYEGPYGRSVRRSRGSGSFDALPRAAVFFLVFKARRELPPRYRWGTRVIRRSADRLGHRHIGLIDVPNMPGWLEGSPMVYTNGWILHRYRYMCDDHSMYHIDRAHFF